MMNIKYKWKLASEHAQRFAKAWDYFSIATNSYVLGWNAAKEHNTDGNEFVDALEGPPGHQQLSDTSFMRWKKEVAEEPFKDAIKNNLIHYNFNDLRIFEDDNGNISFQGTCKKK